MAYINPQLQIDQQQNERNDRNMAAIGGGLTNYVNSFEENRKRAIEAKRLADKQQKDDELYNQTKEINGYKAKQEKYATDQLNKPLEQRDDHLTKIATVKAQEQARVDAESRLRERDANNKKYDAVDSIRKEISGFKPAQDMQQIDTALSKIKTAPNSAAGDMSKIFAYMKILDPNSTVREGEYASAEQARGLPAGMVQAYNKAKDGERLSESQRKDFENSAMELAHSQYQNFKSATTPHRNRLKELGVDEAQVLPAFSQQADLEQFGRVKQAKQQLLNMSPQQKEQLKQQLLQKVQGK